MDTAQQLVLQKILSALDVYRASALHLSVGNPPMMRVGEQLVPMPDQQVLTPAFMQSIVETWLDEKDQKRLHERKDVTIALTLGNKKRFKISVFFQQGHLSASLILIPDVTPSLAELGLPIAAQQLVLTSGGLVLVIGPAGSRRSTTIASFIEYLNQHTQKHIMTIEEPVEILFNDHQCVIEQREVGKDVRSIEEGLEFVLKEDIDVVMVSHLPNNEAFKRALTLTNAGKTVFTTLSANSIVSALTNMVYSFQGLDQAQIRTDLAASLAGVINQRSLTTVSGEKMLIAEVLIPNDSVRAIIQKGDLVQLTNVLLTTGEEGMLTLDMQLQRAVAAGYVTRQEAAKYASSPHVFR